MRLGHCQCLFLVNVDRGGGGGEDTYLSRITRETKERMTGPWLSRLLFLGTDINLSCAVSREASYGGQQRTHWLGCGRALSPRLVPLPSGFL